MKRKCVYCGETSHMLRRAGFPRQCYLGEVDEKIRKQRKIKDDNHIMLEALKKIANDCFHVGLPSNPDRKLLFDVINKIESIAQAAIDAAEGEE